MFYWKKAFTLVELVVTIVIIAILATIWFTSYNWYQWSARDANRISQLQSIQEGLNSYRINHTLPLPYDEGVDIKVNWVKVGTQWYIWEDILELINYSASWVDPIDWKYFSYYLDVNWKYFQLMAFLEEEPNWSYLYGEKLNAVDYSKRIPYVLWDKLWILTDENNTPIQEVVSGEIDIKSNLNLLLKAHFRGTRYVSWTWSKIAEFEKLSNITRTWGKNWSIDTNNNQFVNLIVNWWCWLDNWWNYLVNIPTELCINWTASSVIDNWIWNKYLWSCSWNENWESINCSADHFPKTCKQSSKPSDNGHITYINNPVQYEQNYVKSSSECWFTCDDNFFWNFCENAPLCWVDLWRIDPTLIGCFDVNIWKYSPDSNNSRIDCTTKPTSTISRWYTYTSDW